MNAFFLVILNSNWIFTKSLNYLCGRKTSACLFDFVIGLFILCYFSLAQKFLYKILSLMFGIQSFSKICEWQKNPVGAGWRGMCVAQEQLWVLWICCFEPCLSQPGTRIAAPFHYWSRGPRHTVAICAPILGAVASCISAQLPHSPTFTFPAGPDLSHAIQGLCLALSPFPWPDPVLTQEHPDLLLSRRDCSQWLSASGSTKDLCRV